MRDALCSIVDKMMKMPVCYGRCVLENEHPNHEIPCWEPYLCIGSESINYDVFLQTFVVNSRNKNIPFYASEILVCAQK
jgi:hypothetical protein